MKSNIARKYRIEKCNFVYDDYKYIVQIMLSFDGGKNFFYTGMGKYVKSKKAAQQFIRDHEKLMEE